MAEAEDIVAFRGEVMLAGWSENHNGPPKVVFFLQSPEDLAPFREMTVAKGRHSGQRFAMVLVEIGEDERPVERKGGPLAALAGMFCGQEKFWAWANSVDPTGWARALAMSDVREPSYVAAEWIRLSCNIRSRAELDHDTAAAKLFHEKIRIPYSRFLEGM